MQIVHESPPGDEYIAVSFQFVNHLVGGSACGVDHVERILGTAVFPLAGHRLGREFLLSDPGHFGVEGQEYHFEHKESHLT